MKYEIINPSDKCFITCDNEKVAKFCVILLGNGMYGLRQENGETVDGCFRLFDTEENLNADFDGSFEQFGKDHAQEIANCFKTFEYASDRTSLNNIGALAARLTKNFERIAGGER